MPKYLVETRATIRRHYEVWAANEKEAEAKTSDMGPSHEEDENEETLSVTAQTYRSAGGMGHSF